MSGSASYADWIAVDWGTTRLRAWAMSETDEPRAEAHSDDGMGRLKPSEFEPALLDLIEPWLGTGRTPVFVAGMAGSRQGWAEAPYSAVPCAPLSSLLTKPPVRDARIDVRLIAGLKQDSPADVMRGEETQIAGFLSKVPDFDGVLCLPGTHSKWVHVSAGEVVSFRTFLTGEMFELLSQKSVLSHSVGNGWDDAAFREEIGEAIARPEALAARLFRLRAEALLHGLSPDAAKSRLSGTLIGIELSAARPYWLGQEIALIGALELCDTYKTALAAQGVTVNSFDGAEMLRAGLSVARQSTFASAQ